MAGKRGNTKSFWDEKAAKKRRERRDKKTEKKAAAQGGHQMTLPIRTAPARPIDPLEAALQAMRELSARRAAEKAAPKKKKKTTRQEKARHRDRLREEQKFKLEMRRELAASSEAFSGGNSGVKREETEVGERREEEREGEGEVEEPDEYDVDGVLGDAVWDPEENDEDDELCRIHMFRS